MGKPIIGVVSYIETEGGSEAHHVKDSYIKAVERAGGTPIILPIVNEGECIKNQLSLCNGILIIGGDDINPILYNEEPYKELGSVYTRNDEYQISIVKMALEQNKPVLGICRGHQVLNVACGGTLYQDLSQIESGTIKHCQNGKSYEYSHGVRICSDSILRNLLGEKALVNSYHHQSIKDIGKGLRIAATSSDGVIEAVEMVDRKFVMGIQWHPELMAEKVIMMQSIFNEFVESSIEIKSSDF